MVIDYSWDFTREEFSLDLDFFNEKEQEDKLWQARTGLNFETLCGAIETIIFMSDKPVNLLKIKNQIDPDLPLRVVHESIARLQEEYEQKHHGIRLMEVAQGYQFRTKATFSKIVQNMFKVTTMQLSPTALEVLAILAYKQPISKTEVESIRGVDSSHIIRQLMDKRLVKIVGRSEEVGKPALYGTTSEFLEVFNLNELSQLPSESELSELASASDVASIAEIKSIVNKGDKKRFDYDELEELDVLSSSIKDIASDTLFTQSLKEMDKKRTNEDGVEKKSAFDLLEEYVNQAQIIQQNKMAFASEILTSIMEPKSVDVSLDQLFNLPKDEEAMDFSELPKAELNLEEDFDDSDIVGLEAALDESNRLTESFFEEMNAEHSEEASIEAKASTESEEAQELSEALDVAFDRLMGAFEEDPIVTTEEEDEEKDSDIKDLDLSFVEDFNAGDEDFEEKPSEE